MIPKIWFNFCDALDIELMQSYDEGRDIEGFREEALRIKGMAETDENRKILGKQLLTRIDALPIRIDFPYVEPSDYDAIKAACPTDIPELKAVDNEALFDRIYGAWLGRCAGCLLGQPVEGWKRERIVGLLKATDNYPPRTYMRSDIDAGLREQFQVEDIRKVYGGSQVNWINNVSGMPEDDDTNYTILTLKLMEGCGYDFTSEDVAEYWLGNLPILHVCTAERVAYINLVNQIDPPASASWQNAYREYIGAQIRGDLFGYVCPGDPARAAKLAYRDAAISHVKNGIYGEMFIAALIACTGAAEAASMSMSAMIRTALLTIPPASRLYEAIEAVLGWYDEGIGWETANDRIHERYNEDLGYHWCHVISNAMIVCIGLLFGEQDLEKTLGIALAAGFDTDCNCATAGSVLGMLLGAKALPHSWIAPLNDQVTSGVDGFGCVRISEMAERTLHLIIARDSK